MMEATTLIGLLAAFCTTCSFVPQVLQILRSGNVDGISLQMYSIFTFGITMWLIYGFILQDIPMITANTITLALALAVLFLTARKRMQQKREQAAEQSNG